MYKAGQVAHSHTFTLQFYLTSDFMLKQTYVPILFENILNVSSQTKHCEKQKLKTD